MSTNHSHSIPATQNERSLGIAFILTFSFMLIEFIAGLLFNSLALLSDAAHMFTDAAALAIAFAAVHIAKRPMDFKRTYGYYRFEILAAAFNALLLFGVSFYIIFEAYQRFHQPVIIHSTPMIVVASIGLIVNLICMKLLSSGRKSSMNLKGAYLEVWSDSLGSIGVIIGAIIIRYTGWTWVDTLIAVGIGLWVLPRTWLLLKECLNILLEGAPKGIDVDAIGKTIEVLPGVMNVHDLHVWMLTNNKISLSVHVVHNEKIHSDILIKEIQETLAEKYDIFHTTLQIEQTPCQHGIKGCHFKANSQR